MNTLSRVLHGPGAAHLRTHNRRNATRACFQHAARSITGSHCTQISKGVRSKHAAPQNFWPATNLSSIKIHHIERHTGREWRNHPHTHRNTPHAYSGPAQTPPWTLDPFALKMCSQHTARPRAHASLGRARATSRPSKCIMSTCRVLRPS